MSREEQAPMFLQLRVLYKEKIIIFIVTLSRRAKAVLSHLTDHLYTNFTHCSNKLIQFLYQRATRSPTQRTLKKYNKPNASRG